MIPKNKNDFMEIEKNRKITNEKKVKKKTEKLHAYVFYLSLIYPL